MNSKRIKEKTHVCNFWCTVLYLRYTIILAGCFAQRIHNVERKPRIRKDLRRNARYVLRVCFLSTSPASGNARISVAYGSAEIFILLNYSGKWMFFFMNSCKLNAKGWCKSELRKRSIFTFQMTPGWFERFENMNENTRIWQYLIDVSCLLNLCWLYLTINQIRSIKRNKL